MSSNETQRIKYAKLEFIAGGCQQFMPLSRLDTAIYGPVETQEQLTALYQDRIGVDLKSATLVELAPQEVEKMRCPGCGGRVI